MILVVNHKISTPKDVKESNIWLAVVKALIRSFVETLADNASVLNKACCGHRVGPEVENKMCEAEHRSGCFYHSSVSSLYYSILLRYVSVTPRVQNCKFIVLSVNKEGRLGESMNRLVESSRDSGHVLSDQLGESEVDSVSWC